MTIATGTMRNGTFLQTAGGTPPTPTNKIFKRLDGDLFISIDDKLFTTL